MIYLIVTVLFVASGTSVQAYSVNFTDCGTGNVRDVRVKPCSGDPCIIKLGSTVDVEADFESPINADSLAEVIKGVVRGRELPFPETRKDPCSGYIVPSCPIRKGRKYLFKASFEVKPFYPAIPIKVKYSLTDLSGQLVMCVQVNAKIHDPNPNKNQKNQRRTRNKTKKPAQSSQ